MSEEWSSIPPIWDRKDVQAIADHAFEKTTSFLIFARIIDTTKYYYALYGSGANQAGKIAYGGENDAGGVDGTDPIAVIQSALSALTAGRTSKETIEFRGVFDYTDETRNFMELPSYGKIILTEAQIIDGRPQTAAGKEKCVIRNSDRVNGNTDIEIVGGYIDGQRGAVDFLDPESVGYCSYGNGILFERVTNGTVKNTVIKNCAGNAIGTFAGEDNYFENVQAENCCGYGQFEATTEISSVWVICKAKSAGGLFAPKDGFNFCTNSKNSLFIVCRSKENNSGFFDSNGTATYVACVAEHNDKYGFNSTATDSVLMGCTGRNNELYGVYTAALGTLVIIGGRYYDDQAEKTQDYGINLIGPVGSAIIMGVDARTNADATLDITWAMDSVKVLNCYGRIKNKGVLSVPVPSSGVEQINEKGVPVEIYVSGGVVSDILILGSSTGLTSGHFHLEPDDGITLVYTEAPNWLWVGN